MVSTVGLSGFQNFCFSIFHGFQKVLSQLSLRSLSAF